MNMKLSMKINSMTDVITNSSTSVFCVYEPSNINSIKELVNSILAISGEYTFDDLFNIKFDYNYEAIQNFIEHSNYKEMLGFSDDELEVYLNSLPIEMLESIIDAFYDFYDWNNYQFYEGIKVTAKSDKAKEAAKLIGSIDSIFDLGYNSDY